MKIKYLNLTDEKSVPKIAIQELVKEILSVAAKELVGKKEKDLVVLDVGSGFGLYSQELGKYVKRVVGIEPFKGAFDKAVNMNHRPNVSFYNCPIEDFLTNERFDLVISLTTIEHMPDAEKSFKHILKLMKNNSMIYLTAPNKLWPIEPHYRLLFLSLLPLPIADIYLRVTKKGLTYKDSSYSKTYFGMRNLFDKLKCNYTFILPYSADAIYLGCGTQSTSSKLLRRIGIWLIRRIPIFWVLSKGFIMVIKKK
jgi:2-polyprenyl-3-methyl-5-hydroxy-6-metoxy-1,4-benzoquinol methylase